MIKPSRFVPVFISLILFLSACNLPGGQSQAVPPTPSGDTVATSVALTVAAAQGALTTPLPAPTQPQVIVPTDTLMPPASLPAPASTASPTTPPVPCNWGGFVADLTYEDNAEVTKSQAFVKTWRLVNKGSCTWTSGYSVVFDHGDRMGAPDSVPLTNGTVPPGGTADVSVQLTAPASAGTYQGFFRLKSPDGALFGINASTNDPFWVKVKVGGGSPSGGKPDLVITSMSITPRHPHKGDEITVTIQTYNNGGSASGRYQVEWWSSHAKIACEWDVASSNPGGGKVLTCNYTYNGWSTYEIKAVVDVNDTVDESNENNNVLEDTLVVSP